MDGLFDVLLGNRVQADDAAAEGLEELEIHNVDRVAVRL